MDVFSLVDERTIGTASFGFGIADTVDNYIAAAFVKRGQVPVLGSTYTYVNSALGTTDVVSGATLPTIMKDLAFNNKAIFVPAGYMNGMKNDTVNLKKGQIYGLNAADSNTGEVTESWVLTLMNYYSNISGNNALRSNCFGWDFLLFTNTSVEIYLASEQNAQIGDVLDAVSGDSTKARNGRIGLAARIKTGQVVPLFGVDPANLTITNLAFVLTQGTLVNFTAAGCTGEYKRYNRTTTATIGSIPFTAAPAISCLVYSIEKVVNGIGVPANGTNDATISSTTGTVTFPAAHPTGTTRYIVTVENETGIYGTFKLEVVIV